MWQAAAQTLFVTLVILVAFRYAFSTTPVAQRDPIMKIAAWVSVVGGSVLMVVFGSDEYPAITVFGLLIVVLGVWVTLRLTHLPFRRAGR